MLASNIRDHVRILSAFSSWLHREKYTVENILNAAILMLLLDRGYGARCSCASRWARQGGDRVPPVPMEGALANAEAHHDMPGRSLQDVLLVQDVVLKGSCVAGTGGLVRGPEPLDCGDE